MERAIAVLGSGLAARVVALKLASSGHSVLTFERDLARPSFPRSIPGPAASLLEGLGLSSATLAVMLRPVQRTELAWPGVSDGAPAQPGYLLDADELESALCALAEKSGVRQHVCRGPIVVQRAASGAWRIESDQLRVEASFLISSDSSYLGTERRPLHPPSKVLLARWPGRRFHETRVRVEAAPDGWCWLAGGPAVDVTLLVLHDPVAGEDAERAYQRLTAPLRHVLELPAGPPELALLDGSSSVATLPIAEDSALVGSACLALDPLSAQGVLTAVTGARQLAAVVNTIQRYPTEAARAREFYSERVRSRAAGHERLASAFYHEGAERFGSVFWTRRARAQMGDASEQSAPVPTGPLTLAPGVTVQDTGVLLHDRIVTCPALHHHSLEQPVAFLGGTPILVVVREVLRGGAPLSWVDWLWRRGIVQGGPGAGKHDTQRVA